MQIDIDGAGAELARTLDAALLLADQLDLSMVAIHLEEARSRLSAHGGGAARPAP